jgi:hypothetical protein
MSNSSNPYVDLTGVLNVQKDYLGSVKTQSQDPNSSAIINTIQSNLSNMYDNYQKSNVTTDDVITKQNKMIDITNTEKKRLLDKKQSVDNIIQGQKRALELNNSNRLRQHSYTNLLVILIVTLALFVGIMILSSYFPMVPQTIFDILSIIVISIGIYLSVYQFLDIQSRNNMNFNELNLAPLSNKNAGNTIALSPGKGSLLDLISGTGCIGQECCGPNTVWDNGNSVCNSMSILSGFTTMSFAYEKGDLSSMANVNADGPYEFDAYTPVK